MQDNNAILQSVAQWPMRCHNYKGVDDTDNKLKYKNIKV